MILGIPGRQTRAKKVERFAIPVLIMSVAGGKGENNSFMFNTAGAALAGYKEKTAE